MQGCELFTPSVTRGFGLAQLEVILKAAMQSAGVEGRPSTLLIEDHHITSDDILETVNSLLSAGGVLSSDGHSVASGFHRCGIVILCLAINADICSPRGAPRRRFMLLRTGLAVDPDPYIIFIVHQLNNVLLPQPASKRTV